MKFEFRFGLFLGFLAALNIANLANIVFNILKEGGLFWVANGVVAVVLIFVHVLLIDEVLND